MVKDVGKPARANVNGKGDGDNASTAGAVASVPHRDAIAEAQAKLDRAEEALTAARLMTFCSLLGHAIPSFVVWFV